jgi:ParB family transcriptional regulator, chromosome partitioning protein
MNATTAASTTTAAPQVPPSIQEIPLGKIRESQTNPRRHIDEAKLAELSDNIRQHGVLQPILLRPATSGASDRYELVAGERRYRASKLAGRDTIPATVRELTDSQCLEIQLIENGQRDDVHPLDEAEGYARLIGLDPETYTVEAIAAKMGRSPEYINARLHLIQLIPEAKQAFYDGKLNVTHAFEISRLQPSDQRRALQECFPQHRNTAAVLKDKKAEAVTVRELRSWIEREIHLDLTHAPFDPQDETLLPPAGACASCPKRTGSNPLLFPEVRHKCTCTDRECYGAKVDALVRIRVKSLEADGETPLRVSQAPSWQTNGRAKDVLHEGEFRKVSHKGECPNAKPAVLVDGRTAGTVFHICRDEKCPVHARSTRYQPTPQERAKRAKELLAERVEGLTRARVLDAIRKKLPDTLTRPDLEMVALDYFRRLGHDNHRRLCGVYGWHEKKTKASWGGQTIDYEIITAAAVGKMSNADLNRFVAVCALVSDLNRPGYDRAQSPSKDTNLARTATRYKIDPATVTAAVRAEISTLPRKRHKKIAESAQASKKVANSRKKKARAKQT